MRKFLACLLLCCVVSAGVYADDDEEITSMTGENVAAGAYLLGDMLGGDYSSMSLMNFGGGFVAEIALPKPKTFPFDFGFSGRLEAHRGVPKNGGDFADGLFSVGLFFRIPIDAGSMKFAVQPEIGAGFMAYSASSDTINDSGAMPVFTASMGLRLMPLTPALKNVEFEVAPLVEFGLPTDGHSVSQFGLRMGLLFRPDGAWNKSLRDRLAHDEQVRLAIQEEQKQKEAEEKRLASESLQAQEEAKRQQEEDARRKAEIAQWPAPVAQLAILSPEFTPDGDGVSDTVAMTPSVQYVEAVQRWTIKIFDPEGNLFRTYKGNGAVPETVIWNGVSNDGRAAAPNSAYTAELEAIPSAADRARTGKEKLLAQNSVRTGDYSEEDAARYAAEEAEKERKAREAEMANWPAPEAQLDVFGAPLSPDGDGVNDRVVLTPLVNYVDKVESWKIEIKDENGNVIRTFSGVGELPVEIVWNGLTEDGKPVKPNSTYNATLTVVPSAADRKRSGKDTVTGTARIPTGSFSPEDAERYAVIERAREEEEARKAHEAEIADWPAPEALLGVSESSFTPDGDGVDDTVALLPSVQYVENVQNWKITILDPNGAVFRTFEGTGAVPETVVWNGVSRNGRAAAPRSVYTAKLDVVPSAADRERTGKKKLQAENTVRTGDYSEEEAARYAAEEFEKEREAREAEMANWSAPVAALSVFGTPLTPDGDGKNDSVVLTPAVQYVADVESWRVVILSPDGKVFRTFEGTDDLPDEIIWNGISDSGEPAASLSLYTAQLTVVPSEADRKRGGVDAVKADANIPTGTFSAKDAERYAAGERAKWPAPVAQLAVSAAEFSPDGDGVSDTVTLHPSVQYIQNVERWTIKLLEPNGSVFRTYKGTGAVPADVVWNGVSDNGKAAAPNTTYTAALEAIPSAADRERTGKKELLARNTVRTGDYSEEDAARYAAEEVEKERKAHEAEIANWPAPEAQLSILSPEFTPDGDGVSDTVAMTPSVKYVEEVQRWTIKIFDPEGKLFRTYKGTGELPASVVWNGVSDDGRAAAPNSTYTAELEVIPSAADRKRTGKEKLLAQNTVRTGNYSEEDAARYAAEEAEKERKAREAEMANWPAPEAQLSVLGTPLTPDGDGVNDRVVLTPVVEYVDKVESWKIEISDENGKVVRTFSGTGDLPDEIVWNGLTEDGKPVKADSMYTARLTVVPSAADRRRTGKATVTDSARIPTGTFSAADAERYAAAEKAREEEEARAAAEKARKEEEERAAAEKARKEEEARAAAEKARKEEEERIAAEKARKEEEERAAAEKARAEEEARLRAPVAALAVVLTEFTPDGDGVNDVVTLKPSVRNVAVVQDWSVVISDPAGKRFRSFSGKGAVPEELQWDGYSDSKVQAAAKNTYTAKLSVTPSAAERKETGVNVLEDTKNIKVGALSHVDVASWPAPTAHIAAEGEALTPDGDGVNDFVTLKPSAQYVEQVQSWSITITAPGGRTFRTFQGEGDLPESLDWDGLSDDSAPAAPESTYKANLAVTPSSADRRRTGIRILRDSTDIKTGSFSQEDAQRYAEEKKAQAEEEARKAREEEEARKEAARKAREEEIRNWPAPVATLGIGNPELTPDGDDEDESVTLYPAVQYVEEVERWTITITDPDGNVFRTFAGTGAVPGQIEWDGRSNDRLPVTSMTTYRATLAVVPSEKDRTRTGVDVLHDSADIMILAGKFEKEDAERVASEKNAMEDAQERLAALERARAEEEARKAAEREAIGDRAVADLYIAGSNLTPDGDGLNDTVLLKPTVYNVDVVRSWEIIITDPKGTRFRSFSGTGDVPEELEWDGFSDAGVPVISLENYRADLIVTPSKSEQQRIGAETLTDTETIRTGLLLEVIEPGKEWKIMVNSIYFDANKETFNTLSPEQISANNEAMDNVAVQILAHPGTKVVVEGFANNVSNTRKEDVEELIPLSQLRADTILEQLVERGVSRSRMSAEGKGGANPIAAWEDRENWWKNRRVEFILKK